MVNFRNWMKFQPLPTPQEKLYDAVATNDGHEIKKILKGDRTLINWKFTKHDNLTIVILACGRIKNVTLKTIQILLYFGADINFTHQSDLHWTSLHHAIAHHRLDIAKLLLEKDPLLLNLRNYDGSNALHIAVKNTVRNCGEDDACECIEFLIEKGINVNQLNRYNETPIFVACRFSNKKVIEKILSSKQNTIVDLDFPCKKNSSARQLMKCKNLYIGKLPKESNTILDSENNPLVLLRSKDEDGYLKLTKKISTVVNDGIETPLQIACRLNLIKVIKSLIHKKCSPYETALKNEELPIQITTDNGHLESFKLLLKQYKVDEKSIPYQSVIKMCYNEHNNRLLQHFLQEISSESSNLVKLNEQNSDDHNSTVVHYIVTCTDHKEARKLLTKGASLAVRNDYGRMPIDDIHPKLLEDHLDDCFSNMYSRKAPNFRLFDCNFKSILLPQETSDNLVVSYKNKKLSTKKLNRGVKIEDEEGHKKLLNANLKSLKIEDKECVGVKIEDDYSSGIKIEELNSKKYFLQSDTDVIFSMSQNSQLKHLLQHPLILTFLYLKYQRFHKYLIGNLVFNIILSMALAVVPFFEPILIFFFIAVLILILRQCLYLFIFVIVNLNYKFKRVRSIFQNISHITFIVLLIFLIFFNYKKKEICAFAILLSVVEILLTPDFGGLTHLIILRKVLVNFFYLLIVFIFLILAFALSFFVVFQKKSNSKEEVNQEEEDKTVSFSTFSKSVFKTFIMVTGEFDAGSIQFSLVSQIIFVFFIFIIYIVLMNLLNGLAVTDVQDIKRDAELDHLKVRVECIHFIEKIILSLPNGRRHYTEWCSIPLQFKMEVEMFGERCIKMYTKNFQEEICDRTTKRLLLANRLTLFKNAVKTDRNQDNNAIHRIINDFIRNLNKDNGSKNIGNRQYDKNKKLSIQEENKKMLLRLTKTTSK